MRKLYFTIIALAMSALAANAQVDLNSGLVGYYPFNGTANDATGNGNNGTVRGATLTSDRFGNVNSAYSFNGIDNYIDVANPVGLENTNYTVSVWVKIAHLPEPTQGSYIFEYGPGMPGVYGESLSLSNNYLQTDGWSVNNQLGTSSATRINYQTGAVPSENTWINLVVVRDTTAITIYQDGTKLKSKPTNNVPTFYQQQNKLYIGIRAQLSENYFFNGIIDELRFYNRAINQDEVLALSNEGTCKQTVTVTDTLVINLNKTTYNPITYANTIKIYPNPTKDIITINYGNYNTLTGYTIKLVNSLGETVFTSQIDKQESTINLAGMAKGLYFVHIIDAQNNSAEVRKIILQ